MVREMIVREQPPGTTVELNTRGFGAFVASFGKPLNDLHEKTEHGNGSPKRQRRVGSAFSRSKNRVLTLPAVAQIRNFL